MTCDDTHHDVEPQEMLETEYGDDIMGLSTVMAEQTAAQLWLVSVMHRNGSLIMTMLAQLICTYTANEQHRQ